MDAAFDSVAARLRRPDHLRVDHRTARGREARVDGVFIDAGAAVGDVARVDDEERLVLAARGMITFAAYATSIVSGEAFGATETAAALWIASAVLKLKDAGIDADSIKDNAVNIIIATVMGVIAFAE